MMVSVFSGVIKLSDDFPFFIRNPGTGIGIQREDKVKQPVGWVPAVKQDQIFGEQI